MNNHPMAGMGSVSHHSPGYDLGFVPDQLYPALFQSDAERPAFNIPTEHWENQAQSTLLAHDAPAIWRVIRYRLFHDESLPWRILLSRNESVVENFVLNLCAPQEALWVSKLSHYQKVGEMLRRVRVASPPFIPWMWFPSRLADDSTPQDIATAIDAESRLQFNRIPFEDLVRYSLNYRSLSVDWFLHQHTNLYIHLLAYLNEFPDEIEKYVEVELALRNRSPFAHRAVARCLTSLMPGRNFEIPQDDTPGFAFIAAPIQRLLQSQPWALTGILQFLSVLAIRFRRTYLHAARMDWRRPFDVDIFFFQHIFEETRAEHFAQSLTSLDEAAFARLTAQNIIANDAIAQQYLAQWETLALSVWECASAVPGSIGRIQEYIQSLFAVRNYHSVMALLNGLHSFTISTSTQTNPQFEADLPVVTPSEGLPPNLFYLMNPAQNYAAYRQRFNAMPGVPFLFPHIAQMKLHGPAVIRRLFQEVGLH